MLLSRLTLMKLTQFVSLSNCEYIHNEKPLGQLDNLVLLQDKIEIETFMICSTSNAFTWRAFFFQALRIRMNHDQMLLIRGKVKIV